MNLGLLGESAYGDSRNSTADTILALAEGFRTGNIPGALRAMEEQKMRKGLLGLQHRKGLLDLQAQERENSVNSQLDEAARKAYVSPDQARQLSTGPMPDGSNMFQPAGFNSRTFLDQAYQVSPFKAMQFEQALSKKEAPIKLGQGEGLYDPKTFAPLVNNPKEQDLPSAVKEYEYAKQGGFPGSFADWEIQKRRAGASNVSVNTGQKGLDNELKIRSDFRSEPIYKAHQEVQSAYGQISEALKQQSPAGDLAGATKIMKMLDPGSVVRESELGMAMKAGGALDRLTNYADQVVKGTKLTPAQRKDFQALADKLNAESVNQFNSKRGEYAKFAKDYGLDEQRILGPAITSPKIQGANQTPKFLGFE